MRQRLYILLLGLFLVSCGTAPPVPTDHYYRLTPSTASVVKRRLTEGSIYIENFVAEGVYNDRALLYSSDERANELQQHHYHYWYTSPPHLLHDYLVQFLRNADVSPVIMDAADMIGNFRIAGKVVEFERRTTTSGSSVNVSLELRLEGQDADKPLLLRQYRTSENINGKDMDAVINGYNTAVDRVYGEFLGDLERVLHAQ